MTEVYSQELGGYNQQQELDEEEQIQCMCDEGNCGIGLEGDEVNGHIENCSCSTCHHAYGKLN